MNATPDRIESLFAAAVALPAPARVAWLDEACANDRELRARLEALLQAHEQAGHLLDRPAAAELKETRMYLPSEQPGCVIAGRYKLLEPIGEGGMGAVWVAEQTEPVRRKVALKLIKAGMDSKSVLARFEAERQALAVMDHPNIAKVLDGGLTETGRPFFVMEYVKGVPITEYCDATRLSVPARLNLFVQVCQAVQHAHQKGIIHRDLKPSKVAPYDDKPVPKVIDFGLAKAMHQSLTERTLHTGHETVLGTPLYMSPEQAQLNNLDIDTRSDIYSLGVLLYELLTGSTPLEKGRFKQAAWDEIKRIIREEDPPHPSLRLSSTSTLPSLAAGRQTEPGRLTRLVRGELDWIVMKALDKDRSRRYETANGFAADIQRHLAGEPVLAAPPTARYRLRKFARKHRAAITTAATVAAALLLGTALATWQAIVATRAREAALVALDDKERARAAEAEQRRRAEASEQRAKSAEQNAKREEQRAKDSEAESQAVLDFVEDKVFAAARPDSTDGGLGHDVSLADAVKTALPYVESSFSDHPLIEARLRMTLGKSFLDLGEAKIAVEQNEAARRINVKYLGPEHPITLTSMERLASAYHALGRDAESLQLHEEALALHKAKLGLEHPNTLAMMNNLGNAYSSLKRHAEALKLHEEVLALRTTKFGEAHPDTLASMQNVASASFHLGRHAEALQLREKSLRLRISKLGEDHPDTATGMCNLSISYLHDGRHAEALELREKALTVRKKRLGALHPLTLKLMRELGTRYAKDGRHADAIRHFEEVSPLLAAKYGADNSDALRSLSHLSYSYLRHGRRTDAIRIMRQVLPLQENKLGADHSDTLETMKDLSFALRDAGRVTDAVVVQERLKTLTEEKLGSDHLDTLTTMSGLGWLYMLQQKYPEAELLQRKVMEGRRTQLGPDDPLTLSVMNDLGVCIRRAGREPEATALFEEVLKLRKVKLGLNDAETLQTLANVAYGYAAQGRHEEVLKLYAESVAMHTKKLDPDDASTLLITFHVANAHEALGQHDEALQLREESLKLRAAKLGPGHLDTVSSMYRLARSYTFLKRYAEAKALLEEALAHAKADSPPQKNAIMKCAYQLAVVLALTLPSAPDQAQQAERAVAYLREAAAVDFVDVAWLKQDQDLAPLRDREDFAKLVAGLEAQQKSESKP